MRIDLERRLVAVVFTDMVGYTALMQGDERLAVEQRALYVDALERHHDAYDGTIVQRLGDGSMSMFPSALSAALAALAVQRELSAAGVSVRIGIHVGEVIVEPERLTGDAVNVAARIESFSVPGGVTLSDTAYDQIKNRDDVSIVGLGRFRLKNVGRTFELYALSAEGVVVPEPGSLDGKGEHQAGLPAGLPEQPVPLVGRREALSALADLAGKHRLVTITGPGGVGKTRVLIELGRILAPTFLDRVAFVPFADVVQPDQFLPALAEALDVKEAEGRTLGDGVVALIAEKPALLLLDNLEQIVAAATEVADLVERCPALHIVTTSRTPLRLGAEHEYALAPLEPPPVSAEIESLLDYPAIQLFVERARATRGSFELTRDNAAAVAAVCRRLDGLPLALELAAARLRLLAPEALLERLDHALQVLTSGPRDRHARQQTLRATIDWSHSLLEEREQRLFRRIAVFAGGCTLEDLEGVCVEPGESILDDLESLVEKALVHADPLTGRLGMLQTIAEYARERLESAGEADELELRHAHRFAGVAHEIGADVEGTRQVQAVRRGIAEEANLQAAIETLLAAARDGDAVACEQGLRICGALCMYWHIRGKNITAREYSTAFLAADRSGEPSVGRAGALVTAGLASWMLGELARANSEHGEAQRIAAEIGAGREQCLAAFLGAIGLIGVDLAAGLELTRESIETSRSIGFTWGEGFASTVDGILHAVAGDLETAHARYSAALEIQQRTGDEEGAGMSLGGLAQVAAARGDATAALDLYRRSLRAFETIGDRAEEARILSEIAWTHISSSDPASARQYFLDSARAYTDVASVRGIGLSLVGLAAAETLEERPDVAARLAAAAERYADEEGIVNVYSDETPGLDFVERARAALSAEDLDRATEAGRALTIGEALDLAGAADVAAA